MTSTPEPDPRPPVSPLDLPQLVDALEERNTPEDTGDRSAATDEPTGDATGAPEPPD